MVPNVDYKAARKRIWKKLPSDGDTPEVDLNDRDQFRITTSYSIVEILKLR